jgi:PTH1 family peptidyl-tRNA hydrolase
MFWKKSKPDLQPEWLVVGLGNPGGEYAGTRHNVGFEVIELLAEKHRIKLDKSKHRARFGLGKIGDTTVCLVKPLTYMNLSGQAVAPLARGYGVKPDRILVIADELALPLGKLRLREGGSSAGHNGHKSLMQSLGTQDYPRIRIGIGKGGGGANIDHVLSRFEPDEKAVMETAIRAAAATAVAMLTLDNAAALQVVDAHNKGMQS